ncbi:unnamed protein product [Callosobruchus maculatus]|uniref:P21-activated protein kinase-interacting protein 1-like n=1 Tax=Callosobruchus maculatus TaxID=64391 RepID=A0A653BTF4_CALMS|nr:unnamed protein product [Callosobruchus maculatus]
MSVFEIVAGTYEEFLLGYIFNSSEQKLTQSFATHNHTSSIRCVATAGHYVASGSADDRLMIYDMKKRKEHCMLNHHNATVNAVQFTANGSHVLSGSADGVLSILKTGNWKLEKVWDKAHKGDTVLDIAVHPTGKLALTLGQDYALRTWNLVKGRQAYAINLSTKSKDFRSLEKICWCDDGVKFLLYGGRYTEVWSIETGGILKVVEHPSRVSSCAWTSTESFISGHEDGTLKTVDVSDSAIESFKAHDSRVKSVAKYSDYIVTASSNGEIKVWTEDLEELAKANSGCRITCVCILPVVEIKKEEEDSEEDEEFEVVNTDKGRSRVVIDVEDEDGRVKRSNKKKKKRKLDKDLSEEQQDELQQDHSKNGNVKRKKKKKSK